MLPWLFCYSYLHNRHPSKICQFTHLHRHSTMISTILSNTNLWNNRVFLLLNYSNLYILICFDLGFSFSSNNETRAMKCDIVRTLLLFIYLSTSHQTTKYSSRTLFLHNCRINHANRLLYINLGSLFYYSPKVKPFIQHFIADQIRFIPNTFPTGVV